MAGWVLEWVGRSVRIDRSDPPPPPTKAPTPNPRLLGVPKVGRLQYAILLFARHGEGGMFQLAPIVVPPIALSTTRGTDWANKLATGGTRVRSLPPPPPLGPPPPL